MPMRRMTIWKVPCRVGEEEIEMGASPTPVTETSTNWPGIWPRSFPESILTSKKESRAVMGSTLVRVAGWGR